MIAMRARAGRCAAPESAMLQINPFTGSVVQTPQVQRQQSAQKATQLRRAADAEKDSALREDQLDHQVESSEALSAIHDDAQRRDTKKRPPAKPKPTTDDADESGPSHLDLKA